MKIYFQLLKQLKRFWRDSMLWWDDSIWNPNLHDTVDPQGESVTCNRCTDIVSLPHNVPQKQLLLISVYLTGQIVLSKKVCLPFHFRQIETPFSPQIKLFQLRHCNLDYCKGCQWPISDICFNSTETGPAPWVFHSFLHCLIAHRRTVEWSSSNVQPLVPTALPFLLWNLFKGIFLFQRMNSMSQCATCIAYAYLYTTKINKGRRYSSYRKCVASVNWGHALSVGIQHTASIGLAVNIHFYFLLFKDKLFYYF